MIVVDTSIWIDFFRGDRRQSHLAERIREDSVLLHPWVVGEIALGNLGGQGRTVLGLLSRFPQAPVVPLVELLPFIEHHSLGGVGIGFVDAQLLASAKLARADLLTSDRRLIEAWQRLQKSNGTG